MRPLIAALLLLSGPSITVKTVPLAPVVDGRILATEYGPAQVQFPTASGQATVHLVRKGGYVYIAASLPDTSVYWGDDFVVSLDANGNGTTTPDVGDRQWYLRRVLDSSVVFVVDAAARGAWLVPGSTPLLLKGTRHAAEWDVASTSTPKGWAVELRISEALFTKGGAPPRIAFRTYNDKPRGWFSWPATLDGKPLTVERNPSLWATLTLR